MDATSLLRRALFPPRGRMFVLCLVVGLVGAVAAMVFDAMVDLAHHLLLGGLAGWDPPATGELHPAYDVPGWPQRAWFPVVATLGGLLAGLLVQRLCPEAEGHGTDAAIDAYHHRGGRVRSRVPAVKALASAITIGSGGVAGREGPAAQISVGLASILGRWVGLRGAERRILLLAGMAAGLAAIFRAPIGMAIFTVEILYAGMVFESEYLIFTVLAAVSAYAFHGLFLGSWTPIFAIPPGMQLDAPGPLLAFALLGITAGAFGAVLPTIFFGVRDLARRLPGPRWMRPALGGALVGTAGMFFPELLGTGYGWVELGMGGELSLAVIAGILLLKMPGMALTIGSGGSGGVFGPTVVMGGMLGLLVGGLSARFLPSAAMHPAAFAMVGMAALFAGAARAPFSTFIMVAEMTGGYGLLVPSMLATTLAFLVQRQLVQGRRYTTLYESQVEDPQDSPVHQGVMLRRAMRVLRDRPGQLGAEEIPLPDLVDMLHLGKPIPVAHDGGAGGAQLLTVKVEAGSELDGRLVGESMSAVEGVTLVAILRPGELVVPRGAARLGSGDELVAIVADEGAGSRLRQVAGVTP